MFHYVYFLVVGFAITNAVTFLHIGLPLRNLINDNIFGRLIRCHACFGFWVGFGMSFLYPLGFVFDNIYLNAISDGLFLSGFNFMIWALLCFLGANKL